MDKPTTHRIHKVIAQAGVMSRRKAELAMVQGRVTVNGVVITDLGVQVDPYTDVIAVDGNPIQLRAEKKTWLFYKPRGVVTTKSDELGRPTVMDYFKDDPALNPVGRLDFDSEGLLLLTHDGELALKLTHPRYGVQKIYEVTTRGAIPGHFQSMVLNSVNLEDGPGKFDAIQKLKDQTLAPTASLFGSSSQTGSEFVVTVSEGRNRFVRRMFAYFGIEVVRLKRIQLGPYFLGDLKPGERKELPPEKGRGDEAE